jgi:hypothetical protein
MNWETNTYGSQKIDLAKAQLGPERCLEQYLLHSATLALSLVTGKSCGLDAKFAAKCEKCCFKKSVLCAENHVLYSHTFNGMPVYANLALFSLLNSSVIPASHIYRHVGIQRI